MPRSGRRAVPSAGQRSLGRSRQRVDVASAAPGPSAVHMHPGAGRLLRDALDVVRDLLPGIGDGDLARTTPCTGWDLRTLAAHMVGQNRGFAAAIAAGDAAAGEYASPPVEDAADLLRAWDESVERLLAACANADPDRQVRLVEI